MLNRNYINGQNTVNGTALLFQPFSKVCLQMLNMYFFSFLTHPIKIIMHTLSLTFVSSVQKKRPTLINNERKAFCLIFKFFKNFE